MVAAYWTPQESPGRTEPENHKMVVHSIPVQLASPVNTLQRAPGSPGNSFATPNVVSESSGSKKPKPVWRSPSYENTPPKHKSSTKSSHETPTQTKNENIYIQPVQQINQPVYDNQPVHEPIQ